MVRDIHEYDSLKKAYDVLLMFERFPGPVRSERVEEFVTQLIQKISSGKEADKAAAYGTC